MKTGQTVTVHIKHDSGEQTYTGTITKFFRRNGKSKALVGITTKEFGYTLYNTETRRAVGEQMSKIDWFTI